MRSTALVALSILGILGSSSRTDAEIVLFPSGRTLSARSHRIDGESIVILLRAGGEVVCNRSLVARIIPDEVPYPDATIERQPAGMLSSAPDAYSQLIDTLAAEQGVDPSLVRAVVQVESGFRRDAKSRKGAIGLMQLMPRTARQYAVSDPYDPRANIEGGIKHLKMLLQRYELASALAAYNAGEAAVLRFGGVPPFHETRGYVREVLKLIGR